MKKILLINTNSEKIPYPVAPIGLCILAGILEKKYEVKIYDGMFSGHDKVIENIKEFNPDYLGISIRNIDNLLIIEPTNFLDCVYNEYIKPIKFHFKNIPIILGGSAFSIMPEIILKKYDVDYGIIGEGEEALLNLLNCLDNNIEPDNIPRVITRQKMKINSFDKSYDMEYLPFSGMYEKLNFSSYKEKGTYSIQTKRGCYHGCIYCTYPNIEGKTFRIRNPKNIADEIENVSNKLGDIVFEFVDSTFNDPPGHAEAICKEIADRNLKVNLRTMGINPANVSKSLFDIMLKAGFKQIDCTPDSASPEIIKILKKNFSFEQLLNAAKIIKDYDMPTMWFFIFGVPGEDMSTLNESFEFIDKYVSNYDLVYINPGLRIYPNTELYDIALKEGIIAKDDSLYSPVHYISKKIGIEKLNDVLLKFSSERPNCLLSSDSNPTPEMIKVAIDIRKKFDLKEPMFRTLLRLRYQMFGKIKRMNMQSKVI